MRNVRCHACTRTDTPAVESRAVFCLSRIRNLNSGNDDDNDGGEVDFDATYNNHDNGES